MACTIVPGQIASLHRLYDEHESNASSMSFRGHVRKPPKTNHIKFISYAFVIEKVYIRSSHIRPDINTLDGLAYIVLITIHPGEICWLWCMNSWWSPSMITARPSSGHARLEFNYLILVTLTLKLIPRSYYLQRKVMNYDVIEVVSPRLAFRTEFITMGLLPDTLNCGLRMRRERRKRFPHHQLQRKPLVSDPGKHHGKCVTHVPWSMSGSLNRGGGENALTSWILNKVLSYTRVV